MKDNLDWVRQGAEVGRRLPMIMRGVVDVLLSRRVVVMRVGCVRLDVILMMQSIPA